MIVKYGYVRVSTKDQNENRQLEAMKQLEILKKNIYPKLFTEQYLKR